MITNARAMALLLALLAAAVPTGTRTLAAQANDPLIGTWELDVAKSTYTGGPAGAVPFRREMKFERVENGIKHTTITRDALGGAATSEYTAKFDGKDYPAPVESALDTNAIKRIDPRTIERTGKVKGQVVETVTYTVSPDNKMLTVVQQGRFNGADYGSRQVLNRK